MSKRCLVMTAGLAPCQGAGVAVGGRGFGVPILNGKIVSNVMKQINHLFFVVTLVLFPTALTGCKMNTLISATSEPPNAKIYFKQNFPGYTPIRIRSTMASSQGLFSILQEPTTIIGDILTTPDTFNIEWANVKPDHAMVKVIWEDGVESEPVRIEKRSEDRSIHFKKGLQPTIPTP